MRSRRTYARRMTASAVLALVACSGGEGRPPATVTDRSLVLDGDAWVDFGDPGDVFDLVPGGARTFTLWLRYTRRQYHAKILDKKGQENAPGFSIFVHQYSGSLGMWHRSGVPLDASGYTTAGMAGTRPIGDGKWHHIAVVQRDTLVEAWVDGALDFTLDIARTLPGLANDSSLLLGWNHADEIRFAGEIDDMSIWSRALSGRELRRLMYKSPDPGSPGLEGYWPMDAGDGQTVLDRSPRGRNGAGTGVTRRPATRPLGPPFRKRPVFPALVSALILLAVYGLMRLYAWRLRRQKNRLERQVEERVADLARANAEKDRALETVASQAQRLEALDLAKRRFFTNISHEFRTPLSLIVGPLGDLADRRGEDWDPHLRGAVEAALRNGRRLGQLTEQLLDLARLESGALRLDAAFVDLTQLLTELAQAFRLGAEREEVRLETELPEGRALVFGDPHRLETIFTNLLSNAIRFTPAGGTVRLELAPGDKWVEVRVSDEGPGVPPEQADLIFDRFYQTPMGRERGGGTGIGLALVRELAQLHGGSVDLVTSPGEGAVFRVTLPAHVGLGTGDDDVVAPVRYSIRYDPPTVGEHRLQTGGPEGSPDESDQSLPPLVLIAEDHAELRAYLGGHLSRSYRVVETVDGRSALAAAREQLPDVVVSDVLMPELDGMRLLEQLRADPDLEAVPVILLTARAELDDRVEGLNLGADAYLAKPFEPAELMAQVSNLLEQRKRLRRHLLQEAEREATDVAGSGVGNESDADDFEATLRREAAVHLGEPGFGVNELAARVAMERTGLYRRMMEELGTTPSDFLREARLLRATELLKDGNTVAEVAYAVGYESASSFSRRFRDRFGVTPGSYARSEGGPDAT